LGCLAILGVVAPCICCITASNTLAVSKCKKHKEHANQQNQPAGSAEVQVTEEHKGYVWASRGGLFSHSGHPLPAKMTGGQQRWMVNTAHRKPWVCHPVPIQEQINFCSQLCMAVEAIRPTRLLECSRISLFSPQYVQSQGLLHWGFRPALQVTCPKPPMVEPGQDSECQDNIKHDEKQHGITNS
jgi:hypothetical protein